MKAFERSLFCIAWVSVARTVKAKGEEGPHASSTAKVSSSLAMIS